MVAKRQSVLCAVLITAMAFVLGCNKSLNETQECPTPATEGILKDVVVNASLDESTRIYLDGYKPTWVATDKISLFGEAKTNSELSISSSSGSSATFQGKADANGPYAATFPYDAANSWNGTSLKVNIASTQQLGEKNVADNAMVGVAYAKDLTTSLSFKNVTALFKVTLEDSDISMITLRSGDGSPLSGEIEVNPSTGAVVSTTQSKDFVTLLPKGDVFAPGTYYLAACPGEKTGINIFFKRKTDARTGEKLSENKLSLARSTIVDLGSFKASTTNWGYYIYNFDDLKAWAADKSNWYEYGDDIELRADIDMQNEPWTPVTDELEGTFEGNGHKMYNINVNVSNGQFSGIFGRFYKDVQNITFGSKDGVTYDGTSKIECNYNTTADAWGYAAIVGQPDGHLTNLISFIPITVTEKCTHKVRIGGIAAWIAMETSVEGCVNYGDIVYKNNSGKDLRCICSGIVGGITESNVIVRGCVNYGNITSYNIYTKAVSGVVGLNYSQAANVVVEDCKNYGTIKMLYSATHNDLCCVGGVMGRCTSKSGAEPTYVRNCENYGDVLGCAVHIQAVGGIVGRAEGAHISSCVNRGTVTADHSKNATGRAQTIGGIVGGCYSGSGLGLSSIISCQNHGKVVARYASCGHEATKSTSAFLGVAGGGIIGLVDAVKEISSNKNYANVDFENSYKGTSAMPAMAYVGGIMGFDLSECSIIQNNTNATEAVISAKTTNTSSAIADIKVGGVVGYLSLSTMASGTNHGAIVAQKSDKAGTIYAGTVCGYNDATITLASYAGTCLGNQATASNIIGGGNAPVSKRQATDETIDNPGGTITDPGYESGNWD